MADGLLRDLPGDLPTFLVRFRTDAQCRAYLALGRWPDGFRCASCGHARAYSHRVRLIEECAACGKQHSLLAGTIFEQTKTGLARWFLAIWLVTSSKGGISAMELQRQMGFGSYQTAWSWLHKIRKAWSGRTASRWPSGSRPTRPWWAGSGQASAAVVLRARPWSPARSRRRPARGVAAGSAGSAAVGGRRLGREPGRLLGRPRAAARRGHHRRLARLCRAGPGRLPPRDDQPHHRLGRRRAAAAGDPPRLRPRQALAARHAPRRCQRQAPAGLSRRVCLPLQPPHRQQHRPPLRPPRRAGRPNPTRNLPRLARDGS